MVSQILHLTHQHRHPFTSPESFASPFPLPFPNLILPDPQEPTHQSINLTPQIPCQRPVLAVSKGADPNSKVVEGISLTDAPVILLRAEEAVHDNDGSMLGFLARWRPVEVVCEGEGADLEGAGGQVVEGGGRWALWASERADGAERGREVRAPELGHDAWEGDEA